MVLKQTEFALYNLSCLLDRFKHSRVDSKRGCSLDVPGSVVKEQGTRGLTA
jgi:hypothetical protein